MITNFKIFEEQQGEDWVIDITNIVDKKLFEKIESIDANNVKDGDIIICVYFDGDFTVKLMKVTELNIDPDNYEGDEIISFGTCDDDFCYDIKFAWGIFDPEEYKKYDPNFEIKLKTHKYNI